MTIEQVTLSNIERHELSETQMRERIKLSYSDAIEVFISCIHMNQVLAQAFSNFVKSKNEIYRKFVLKEDLLIHTALDKFLGKLFFTILHRDMSASHIEFNNETKEFITLYNFYKSEVKFIRAYSNHTLKLDPIKFILNFQQGKTILEVWNQFELSHSFENQNAEKNQTSNINNQPYRSDHEYSYVRKTFCQFSENYEEKNNLCMGMFCSEYNPAHITMLFEDIEGFKRKQKI